MSFPFITLGLLVVGAGSAGYLVWNRVMTETPKERFEKFKKEVLTNCGTHPEQRSNKQDKGIMDKVSWENCFEKRVNKFFPTIPLDRYRANKDLWVTEEEREKQIGSICGKNAQKYDIDCWRSIHGIITALEINNIKLNQDK